MAPRDTNVAMLTSVRLWYRREPRLGRIDLLIASRVFGAISLKRRKLKPRPVPAVRMRSVSAAASSRRNRIVNVASSDK